MPFASGISNVKPVEHFQDKGSGLPAIVAYKLIKATLQLAGTALLLYEQSKGSVFAFAESVEAWLRQVTFAVGLVGPVANWLQAEATPKHLLVGICLLGLDGVLTSIEGVGLHFRQRWAAWLVVIATGMLLPFEVWELIRRFTLIRSAVLLINLAIVVYLILRVLHHTRSMRPVEA